MKLVLIRHAIAEERDDFAKSGKSDDLRPLTNEGRKKMRKVARGLKEAIEEVDILATSPLKRAVQTAEIIADEFDEMTTVVTDSLQPEKPFEEFASWLQHIEDARLVAAVGHEPHLSSLASWLMTGDGTSRIAMKKGSALLLDFPGEIKAGGAQLLWFMTPAQLRFFGS